MRNYFRRVKDYSKKIYQRNSDTVLSFRGFSFVEVMVVITILLLISVLVFQVMGSVRKSVDKSRCVANLRQIGQVIHLYAVDNSGDLVSTLSRNEGTTSGTVWVQILNSAGLFETGPLVGPRSYPRWHMNPSGMFTCPSIAGREEGRDKHMAKYNLTPEKADSSTFFYDGLHYGMLGQIAGNNNRREYGEAALKMHQFENPATTMIVGEANYQYLIYPTNVMFRPSVPPHGGSFYLNLDGSVNFWEGPLPLANASADRSPPFW